MAGTLYLGTSGFAYDEWKGPFYPPGTKQQEMLPFYAKRFSSVEVNYTFRQQPAEKTLVTWRDATPEGFLITLKAHQRITHWLRLANADESVATFLDRAKVLGSRLGTILFQTPPTLRADLPLLQRFLDRLPDQMRFAFEFRHDSWRPAGPLLAERGVAWCVAETDEVPFETELPGGPFDYLRLRRTSYGPDRLQGWARRIDSARGEGRDVFCYFKHEEGAAGARFALALVRAVA